MGVPIPVVPPPTQARLVGSGDGSVMLYCRACHQSVTPAVGDLFTAVRLWAMHRSTHRVAS